MSATSFSGWVAINAFTPSPAAEVTAGSIYTVDLSDFSGSTATINWDQADIPPQFVNTTPLTIANIAGYDVAYDTRILINGQKWRDCGSTPYTHIIIQDRIGTPSEFTIPSNTQDTAPSGTTFWTNGNPSLLTPDRPTTQAQWDVILNGAYIITNKNFRIPQAMQLDINTTACRNYDAYNYTLTVLLRIYVTNNCQGNNLQVPVCTEFCAVELDKCLPRYIEYCFTPTPIIGRVQACRDFFATYIPAKGSPAILDNALVSYCRKYRGFADLFDADSTVGTPAERAVDLNLCACHLSSHEVPDPDATVLYRNFQASLAAQIPYFNNLSFIPQCLVPECAGSPFKPTVVPNTGCPLPTCINIVSVDNNGTINGNVNVDIDTPGCANVNNGGTTTYTWTYLLAIAIIIIIVILAILYVFGYIK
ncbi:Hypothetical protein POVR1_LOCUS34 [uncultured virus]|nr:Hypothetical protein POVR1_LOCUS34 [uncultured virus]